MTSERLLEINQYAFVLCHLCVSQLRMLVRAKWGRDVFPDRRRHRRSWKRKEGVICKVGCRRLKCGAGSLRRYGWCTQWVGLTRLCINCFLRSRLFCSGVFHTGFQERLGHRTTRQKLKGAAARRLAPRAGHWARHWGSRVSLWGDPSDSF